MQLEAILSILFFPAIQYLATYIIVTQELFSDGISGKSYGLW